MSNSKSLKWKRFKRKTTEVAIKGVPILLVLVSITLTSIFSGYIPFIKEMDATWKAVVITLVSLGVGLIVFFVLTMFQNHSKKQRVNKGMQAKWMKGERVINSNKSPAELKQALKESDERIKLEQERQQSMKETLHAYNRLSKYEDDVESVDL